MKWLSLAVLSVFSFSVTAQVTEINKTDSKGRKQGYWEKKDEKTGVLKYKGTFKDNKPTGEFVYYYASGKVKSVVNNLPDNKTARAKIFYESGKVMSAGKYINQKKDSVWTHYDEAGWVSFREPYLNDKLEGKVQIYFHTSKLSETYVYKAGIKDGEWVRYFESGITMVKGTYKNNYLNGTVTRYRQNGTRESTEYYLTGFLHGPQTFFDESGKELETFHYLKGKKLEGKALEDYLKKLKADREKQNKGNSTTNTNQKPGTNPPKKPNAPK